MKWIIFNTFLLYLAVNSKPLLAAPSRSTMTSGSAIQGDHRREIEDPKDTASETESDIVSSSEFLGRQINDEKVSAEPSELNQSPGNTSQNPFLALLQPLAQRIQFSPQKFFAERLSQLKEALTSLGILTPNNSPASQTAGRQLPGANGLIHLSGLDDNGFYTDRLEPAGFFSGNGWFANKGGLLGGPGAIFSTGSVLTDYPTPYKK